MIHFIRPYWLLMLIPSILYVAWIIHSYRQKNPWKSVCDPHLLPALLQHNQRKSRLIFYINLFLFFVIAIVALAGPAWQKKKLPIYRNLSSLMVVLDLSPEMQLTDLKPNRLARAKFKIRDLISASHNMQMGLVVFSREAFIVTPLSQDANTVSEMLDELHPQMMPISGSDIAQGLMLSMSLLKQTEIKHSNLLLITASPPTSESFSIAKTLGQAGNQLNILAMIEQNALTQATIMSLQELAKLGGGALYFFTSDNTDIKNIQNNIKDTQTIKDERDAQLWQDAGPWFCLILIPLVLLIIRERI